MRIAFVSLRAREALAYGIQSLTGALRQAGHEVALVQADAVDDLLTHPIVERADVLAMSATTGLHRIYIGWTQTLRAAFPQKGLVLGGPHATFFPQVLTQAPWDGVCIGEGEESFPEFLEAYTAGFPTIARRGAPRAGHDGGEPNGAPAGWWIRRDHGTGPVERGPQRPPVLDLDRLPPPAYDILLDARPEHGKAPNKAFLATRGCPYRCTYCFNRTLNDRYRPYRALFRTRDPEAVCDDILAVQRRWGIGLVWFLDANFCAHVPWLERFAAVYRRRVALPFMCKLRPERASEKVVRLLAEAGCTAVGVGIECGSQRLRAEMLGRPIKDADILAGCRQLKAVGLRVLSFSMLGIPGETLDEALSTVALNAACGVDFAAATVLQPYPGTEIARRAIAAGHFDGDFDRLDYSYFGDSPFAFAEPHKARITNLQRLFSFAVEFPEVRRRLRWLIDRRPVELYGHLFNLRHRFAMERTFYRAFTRFAPRETGTRTQLQRAQRDLALMLSSNPESRPAR